MIFPGDYLSLVSLIRTSCRGPVICSQVFSAEFVHQNILQGLPEGHTEPCYPLRTPGLDYHKKPIVKDTDAGVAERRRFQLIGNAVTVPVSRLRVGYKHCSGGQLQGCRPS